MYVCLKVGSVFAEMDLCLQHSVHVCNGGSLFVKCICVGNTGFIHADLGLCLQPANKGGVVCVNAKIASVKY
jgi:hypothetical protein